MSWTGPSGPGSGPGRPGSFARNGTRQCPDVVPMSSRWSQAPLCCCRVFGATSRCVDTTATTATTATTVHRFRSQRKAMKAMKAMNAIQKSTKISKIFEKDWKDVSKVTGSSSGFGEFLDDSRQSCLLAGLSLGYATAATLVAFSACVYIQNECAGMTIKCMTRMTYMKWINIYNILQRSLWALSADKIIRHSSDNPVLLAQRSSRTGLRVYRSLTFPQKARLHPFSSTTVF